MSNPLVIVTFVQSVEGEAQFVGDPVRPSIAYVEVLNQGTQAASADVRCVVRGARDGVETGPDLATMATRVSLAAGERRIAYLSLPIAAAGALVGVGDLPVTCSTRPSGSKEKFVETRTDWVFFRPYTAPALHWRTGGPAIDAYDCATGAVPVAGRDLCVDAFIDPPAGLSSEVAQAMPIAVRCALGKHEAHAVVGRMDEASLRWKGDDVGAGRRDLRCTVDADHTIPEADERDNDLAATIDVLAQTGDWRYAAAIRAVGARATYMRGSDESPIPPAYLIEVKVANTGAHPWRAIEIDCDGPNVHFTGGGASSLPEHLVPPGDLTITLGSRPPLPPPGRVTLACTLRVTSPTVPIAAARRKATLDLPPP